MSAGKLAEALGFTPELLEQLRALALQNRRMLPGPGAGRKRSPRAGASVELMDYRNYVPGDDLRRLDWNVLARLDAPFVRVFRAEENLLVRILVDVTRSMSFGTVPKLQPAKQLAGALAYVALLGGDRVVTAACGGERLGYLPAASGEAGTARIWHFLADLRAEGRGDFARQAAEAASRLREPGLTILLTDGLFEGGLLSTLRTLLAAGQEVLLLQVLDREELEPTLTGDWKLTDAELPATQVEVTLTAATLREQRERVRAYTLELRDFCRRHGATWLLLPADTPLEQAVLQTLRAVQAE